MTESAQFVDAADNPLARLAAIRSLLELVDAAQKEAVAAARTANTSWGAIGDVLGVSKQAVAKRFGTPKPPAVTARPAATSVPVERDADAAPRDRARPAALAGTSPLPRAAS